VTNLRISSVQAGAGLDVQPAPRIGGAGPVQGSVVGPLMSLSAEVMEPGVFVEATPDPQSPPS